jgi:hypothetical protein
MQDAALCILCIFSFYIHKAVGYLLVSRQRLFCVLTTPLLFVIIFMLQVFSLQWANKSDKVSAVLKSFWYGCRVQQQTRHGIQPKGIFLWKVTDYQNEKP